MNLILISLEGMVYKTGEDAGGRTLKTEYWKVWERLKLARELEENERLKNVRGADAV